MKKISVAKLDALFDAISNAQALYIPVDTDKNVADFKQYESGMTMTEKLNTSRSAKDFFFPQMENLYEIKMNGKKLELTDTREECEDFVIFGAKACDVRSFDILDMVYLTEPVDSYYKNRRDHGTVVALACNRPEETCFCTAFGINPAEPAGDVSAWVCGDDMFLQANTEKGEALLASVAGVLEDADDNSADVVKSAIETVLPKLPLAKVSFEGLKGDDLMTHFKSEIWSSASESCLGCGTCTFVCPTCQCYDIREFDTGNGIKKFRCWDSCMYSDFTKMAHGNPRTSQLERFRQRFMHKLVYFPDNNNGVFGCVGCGRCVAKCPINMNILKVAKALEVAENE